MKILWAPWRIRYITKPKPRGCAFCLALSGQNDRDNLILCRTEYAFVIMNRYPYACGHLMILPKRHAGDLRDLLPEEERDLIRLLKTAESTLETTMHPEGFNIGLNLGQAAGAGIRQHIHFHIVPRWNGDSSFISVLEGSRIIPQSLNKTFDKLQPLFEEIRQGD